MPPLLTFNVTFTPTYPIAKAAVGFLLTSDGLSDSQEALTSEEVVPWGTYRVIQVGARDIRRIEGTAYFEEQLDLDTLMTYVSDEGTLTLDWTTLSPVTAVLKSAKQNGEDLAGIVRSAAVLFLVESD